VCRGQFHQHLTCKFFVRKFVKSQILNREKLLKRLLYQKCVRKMLMKLTLGKCTHTIMLKGKGKMSGLAYRDR